MKIRHILEAGGAQPAFQPEDDQQQPPAGGAPQGANDNTIDGNLQQIAQGVGDQNAQPDLPAGSEPQNPELDNSNAEPIDDALLAQLKGMPFATKYNFNPKMKITPMKIAAMGLEDLSNLRETVRFKMQNIMMQNQVGLDDDPTIEYCTDLLRFVNTAMAFKRQNAASQLTQYNPGQAYQTMRGSK